LIEGLGPIGHRRSRMRQYRLILVDDKTARLEQIYARGLFGRRESDLFPRPTPGAGRSAVILSTPVRGYLGTQKQNSACFVICRCERLWSVSLRRGQRPGMRAREWPLPALPLRWLIRPEGPESTHCCRSSGAANAARGSAAAQRQQCGRAGFHLQPKVELAPPT
jgi:hypothetical protein